ncbi:MAG: GAF domain-containing protein, partial [Caldilineaceae bacterium]
MNVPALMATYQLRQREYLLRITRAMTSRLDLPSLLKLILNSAAEMVGCRAGLIVLQDDSPDSGKKQTILGPFQVRAIYNIPPKFVYAFEPLLHMIPPTNGDSSLDSERSESYYLDLQSRVRQVEDELGITLGQVVGLPLLFENELLGIIFLFRAEYAFTEMDWEFLQGFAHQAAIAVRNARIYNQLETERSRLAAIIDNSADGILILDEDRRVVVMNQALSAMVGMSEEEAHGKACHEVLSLENVTGDDLCQPGVELDALGETGTRCE